MVRMTSDDETTAKNQQRYTAAQHAIQSGIASLMNYDNKISDPKHLRVGINSALRDFASLSNLLVKKGVVTEAEVWEAMANGMEEEKELMEVWLSRHVGTTVTLA